MTTDDLTINSPPLLPADELFDVRDRIKELVDRERFLRNLMINEPTTRTGNRYVADVKDVTTHRTDYVEMRKAHPDIFDEFTYPLVEKRVEKLVITVDGELVRPSRSRKEVSNAQ